MLCPPELQSETYMHTPDTGSPAPLDKSGMQTGSRHCRMLQLGRYSAQSDLRAPELAPPLLQLGPAPRPRPPILQRPGPVYGLAPRSGAKAN